MCTRTKTTYGCGHSYKTDVKCHDHRCAGIERYQLEHEGDCKECRQYTKEYRKAQEMGTNTIPLDRGKMGLGRYGKEIRRERGRSQSEKPATGATESAEAQRRVLAALRQQQAANKGREKSYSKSNGKYRVAPSQPLDLSSVPYKTDRYSSKTRQIPSPAPSPPRYPPTSFPRSYDTGFSNSSSNSSRRNTSSNLGSSNYSSPQTYSYPEQNKSSSQSHRHHSHNRPSLTYSYTYPVSSKSGGFQFVNIEERKPAKHSRQTFEVVTPGQDVYGTGWEEERGRRRHRY